MGHTRSEATQFRAAEGHRAQGKSITFFLCDLCDYFASFAVNGFKDFLILKTCIKKSGED
jgi:hypothetical protein